MKNKILLILMPMIIILAASFLFLLAGPAISAYLNANPADFVFAKQGTVLSAVERISDLPEQTYYSFYPEYNLPQNENKIAIPRRLPNKQDVLLYASSSAAIDMQSGKMLWSKNAGAKRQIASLTKLMTALVFLDTNPNWEKVYQLKKEDVQIGGKSYIYPGDEVKIKDLFYLMLVGSDNTAAVALVKANGFSEEEFIKKMNEKAAQLGLKNTSFKDISGLSGGNVSTTEEILVLARKSFFREKISTTSLEEKYEFSTAAGRVVDVESTDSLLSVFPVDGINIIGGKTGHTDEAGYCFTGEFTNETGQRIIAVVLGTDSNEARFRETKKLVKWAYDSYEWVAPEN
jgi:serine-type D-Ala-D-Ala carboxypeptidase (penicillin-binding protein 5/6)